MSLGIYIHIPFCAKKCAYCDFLSFSADEEAKKQYVSALIAQIKKSGGGAADSVFIGGGTPSVLDGEDILKIMGALKERFELSADCEATIEINPATVTVQKLEAYKRAGINRVSMGVQSFSDKELGALGRLHNSFEAEQSFKLLRQCGFSNINLDLMFAIPNQTADSFKETLKTATALNPEHISAYSLIIEEGTPFFDMEKRGEICEADEDLYVKMFDMAGEVLKESGYNRYEISNFSKKGFECRHNLKYWSGEDYLGFGLGAVGFLGNVRYENTRDFKSYLNGEEPTETVLSEDELMKEYIITSLRKAKGINLAEFKEKFGVDFFCMFDTEKYIGGGFMKKDKDNLFFTEDGIRVSNEILCMFV